MKFFNLILTSLLLKSCTHLFAQEVQADETVNNVLQHKSCLINNYLEGIKFNSPEKTELARYIESNGTYLEIGTGGDPIAFLLKQIPKGCTPTIIAADIDDTVLSLLPERHPALKEFLSTQENSDKPKLKLIQLDATNMSAFENNTLSGINASAVVHEILSYAGGQVALESFFKESFRVLKKDGVLIYRDPEGVSMPNETVVMDLKTKSVRLFAHLFLCKFLEADSRYLCDENRVHKKHFSYRKEGLKFNFYKKGSKLSSVLSYKEYLAMPTHKVDFNRKYSIELPRQLCREIERHYLTFLHDCNPFVFIKLIPDVKTDQYHVIYLSQRIENKFLNFAKKYHLSFVNGKITADDKEKITAEVTQRMTHIENGIRIRISSKEKLLKLKEILIKNQLNPETHLYEIENHWVLLDYRVFGLHYNEISKWFDKENAPFGHISELAAKWLMLEGDENYFYSSVDSLIAWVGHLSLKESIENGNTPLLLLCPISPDENKFISRSHYEELLRDSINITNNQGYDVEIREGKRMIHFSKIEVEEAIKIYMSIVKDEPQNYPMLNAFIEDLQNFDQNHK